MNSSAKHCPRNRVLAQTADTIENPVTHDRITFRVTAHNTNGARLEFDDFLLAGYISPPEHIHPLQQERFEVISGSLTVTATKFTRSKEPTPSSNQPFQVKKVKKIKQ
jgi:hypothetical protein